MQKVNSPISYILRVCGVPPWLAVLGLATGQVRAQAAAFTTFDAPGAGSLTGQGTFPQSINGTGSIAGFYVDASNVGHGFVQSNVGVLTSFDGPGATTADAINTPGDVTGYYLDTNAVSHGFIRTP
jgi:hypothetical protein